MTAVAHLVAADYELGALSSGQHRFYARLGWEPWTGPTFHAPAGADLLASEAWVRPPDEDGGIMILRGPSAPDLDLTSSLACDWRAGDVW